MGPQQTIIDLSTISFVMEISTRNAYHSKSDNILFSVLMILRGALDERENSDNNPFPLNYSRNDRSNSQSTQSAFYTGM